MRLRALLDENIHLNIWCAYGDCRAKARWTAAEACERLGPETPIEGAVRRLRCSACGASGKWGHLSVFPCTLDQQAAQARERASRGYFRTTSPDEELEAELASLRRLLGGQTLGGDGPVQWPLDGPSKGW